MLQTIGRKTIMRRQNHNAMNAWAEGRCPSRRLRMLAGLTVGAMSLGMTALSSHAAGPAYEFRALAYIGTPAPGGGAFTNDFEADTLNDFGVLAFTSEPDQPGE